MSSHANIMIEMARMNEKETDLNYHKYLTEKLDKGEPNIVVDSVIRLVVNKPVLFDSNRIRIADFGCFTGSIINRVSFSLPESLRQKTSLFGFDNDTEIVKQASLIRPQISFYQYNITETPPKIDPFQIGILSNVLHEIYSSKLKNKDEAKKLVANSLKNIQYMIDIGGFLVVLDGILPDNQNKIIDMEFLKNDFYSKFIQFTESGYCVEIPYQKNKDQIIKTTLGSLSAFLVKSRYLETTFWRQESQQVYNYFTKDDFKEVLSICGFTIEEQYFFNVLNIDEKLKILDSTIRMPFKNTLILARRTN